MQVSQQSRRVLRRNGNQKTACSLGVIEQILPGQLHVSGIYTGLSKMPVPVHARR